VGARWKCSVCADYDNCNSCAEKEVHDQSHPLLKIDAPAVLHPHNHIHPHPHAGRRHVRDITPQPWEPVPAAATPPAPGDNPLFCRKWAKLQRAKNLARFVKDVTIPDGVTLAPGTKFIKTWRIRNSGATAWPEQTALHFVGGDLLAEVTSVHVGAIKEGEETDISIEMIAPPAAGRYTSYWRLCGPDGVRFGHRIWTDITVAGAVPAFPDVAEANTTPPPLAVPPTAPPVSAFMTPDEAKGVQILQEMNFQGDLLGLLRKHNGQILPAVRELCG